MTKPTTTDEAPASLLPAVQLGGDLVARADVLVENTGGVLDVGLLPRLTPPAGGSTTWAIPSAFGDRTAAELDVIVLTKITARAYWSEPMGNGDNLPACTSRDGVRGEGTPGGSCAACPLSEWGSSTKPGSERAQACREFRILPALVLPSLELVLLRIPPTSIVAADRYALSLASAGFGLTQVVTRATLEVTRSTSGFDHPLVHLEAVGEVTDATQVKAVRHIASLVAAASAGTVMSSTSLADA